MWATTGIFLYDVTVYGHVGVTLGPHLLKSDQFFAQYQVSADEVGRNLA